MKILNPKFTVSAGYISKIPVADGILDNKFLAFCEKIAIPVARFFTIIYVSVTNFCKKIINKIAKKEKFEIIDLKTKEEETLEAPKATEDTSSNNEVVVSTETSVEEKTETENKEEE